MTIGQAYELPLITKNFLIRTSQVNTDQNWDYEILFNKNEWKINVVAYGVSAKQSFLPAIPFSVVKMDVSASIISKNPDGDALMEGGTLEWGPISNGDTMNWRGQKLVTLTTPPQNVYVRIKHTYRLPYQPVSEQVATVTDSISVVLVSLVDNPTSTPTVGSATASNTNPFDWNQLIVPAIVGAVVVAGVAVAIGYASSQTGINVDSLGQGYSFLERETRPARKYASSLMSDAKKYVKKR